jgi:Uma2 family endonuclease
MPPFQLGLEHPGWADRPGDPDASRPGGKNIVLNPAVIVEVTSDSTESYDRGEKFEHYRQIPELLEYVLVSHRGRLVEVFRRGEGDRWIRFEARQRARARLESINCELDVNGLYEGIELHAE